MRYILFTIFFALLLIFFIKLCSKYREGFNNQNEEKTPILKRPFVKLYDNLGNKLNVIL